MWDYCHTLKKIGKSNTVLKFLKGQMCHCHAALFVYRFIGMKRYSINQKIIN